MTTWTEAVEKVAQIGDVAAMIGGTASWNAKGAQALSELLRTMATELDRHAKIVASYDARMAVLKGCGDGYCMVTGKASGMHTNGGCRCYNDRMRAQLVMSAARRMRDDLAREAP